MRVVESGREGVMGPREGTVVDFVHNYTASKKTRYCQVVQVVVLSHVLGEMTQTWPKNVFNL